MTSFDFPVSDRDATVVREIKDKNVENVKDIVGELDLDELEELSRLMTEKGKAMLTDQNIRQYAILMKECREIEVAV